MLTHRFSTMLTLSEITSLIATHHPNWQVCFLNNADCPVIGVCPNVAWTVFFDGELMIERTSRHGVMQRYSSTYLDWQEELIAYHRQFSDQYDCPQTCDYVNGLMGFIGYDLPAWQLNHDIVIKQNQPCAYLGHYDICIKPTEQGFELVGRDSDEHTWHELKQALTQLLNTAMPAQKTAKFRPSWTKADYLAAFDRIGQYIMAGDVYQINLTQKWTSDLTDLASSLPQLHGQIKAPFTTFLKLNEFEILSVSPELFFEFTKTDEGICVLTKPIKGTRPRHTDADVDDALKNSLASSEKDISENLMIVDLLRNDLGRYAHIGTVKTPKLFDIESFKNVHHMVSTITAELEEVHSLTVLFGSLPAGSITGTPKKRACEIIHELEDSPRGAYCGTMGYLNFDGTGRWNVLIRTLQKSDGCELWAGGGITIKSEPDSEYQECLDKVGNVIEMIAKLDNSV